MILFARNYENPGHFENGRANKLHLLLEFAVYNRAHYEKLKFIEAMLKKYFFLSSLVIITALVVVITQWFPVIEKHAREKPPATVFRLRKY